MFYRLIRALRAILFGSALAANPLKSITLIVLGVMIPYLIYAFLGGAVFVLILIGIAAGVWWLANKKNSGRTNLTS